MLWLVSVDGAGAELWLVSVLGVGLGEALVLVSAGGVAGWALFWLCVDCDVSAGADCVLGVELVSGAGEVWAVAKAIAPNTDAATVDVTSSLDAFMFNSFGG